MEVRFKILERLGLKDYLIKYYSYSFFGYLRFVKAKIKCNENYIHINDIVNVDDEILITYTPIKQEGNPSSLPIKIVYEDDDCIVINKDPGVTTCPSCLHQEDTLFNRLQYYFKDTDNTLHFISRLDKDTSGLVLIAKNQYAACLFNKVRDTFVKEYIAETHLPLPKEKDTIELPIKRMEGMKRWVFEDGHYAKTEYELMYHEDDIYRYRVRIYTGRTHQIRVHFAYLGAPIINDFIYGDGLKDSRMHLHAAYLKFYHPLKKERIELHSFTNFE